MKIAEVFGFSVTDQSDAAWAARGARFCRFRNTPCTKASIIDPLGICSLSDGSNATSLCPVRFLDRQRIFGDAARIAFGAGSTFAAFPEIRILKLPGLVDGPLKKIGKVDFLLGKVVDGQVVDFAAVEVQAVYFSGGALKPAFKKFLATRSAENLNDDRRPDFRSSAQKRLVPQLQLKVPVFRRWGKKFFVVVDAAFFGSLPTFERTTAPNSEITWLAYPFAYGATGYELGEPDIVHSSWDDVQTSLREGRPPEPIEILEELQAKLQGRRNRPTIQIC